MSNRKSFLPTNPRPLNEEEVAELERSDARNKTRREEADKADFEAVVETWLVLDDESLKKDA